MTPTPGQIVQLRLLSHVPISEYADLAPPKNALDEGERRTFFQRLRKPKSEPNGQQKRNKPKHIELNAAAWMSFGKNLVRPVSFWISIEDDKGTRSFLVDEQRVQGIKSTMLSGSVRFKVNGHLKRVSACCGGISSDDSFRVDELYVKRNHDYKDSGHGGQGLTQIAI